MRKRAVLAALGAVIAAIVAAGPAEAADVTKTVRSFELLDGWLAGNEVNFGTGAVVLAPRPDAPAGTGVAEMTSAGGARTILFTPQYAGTRLADLDHLSYAVYRPAGTPQSAIFAFFDVDADLTTTGGYQGRLTSILPAGIPADQWTVVDARQGLWYTTSKTSPIGAVCNDTHYCTWDELLDAFPNAGIYAETFAGLLGIRLGGGEPGPMTSYVDQVRVGVTGDTTTYDFEPGAHITTTAGPSGTTVTVVAYGFKPGVNVKATYDADNGTKKENVKLCSARADAQGTATCTGTIPKPKKAGATNAVHNIYVTGRRGGYQDPTTYTLSFLLLP